MSSECSDGERFCHCQPLGIYRDSDNIEQERYGPVEETPIAQGPSMGGPWELSLPLRSPVYTDIFAPTGAALGEATIAAAPDAKPLDQDPSGADLIVDAPEERTSDDPQPQDSMNRVTAKDANPDRSMHFQGSLHQSKANDREWDISNENGIYDRECMTPITRGILEWIEETDFDCSAG